MSSIDRVEKRLKRLGDRTYQQPVYKYPGMKYFYVFGFTREGKKVILGPYTLSAEADARLATLDSGEIFELDTRNETKATQIIKEILMQRSGDADEALKRVLHQKVYEHEKRRGKKK